MVVLIPTLAMVLETGIGNRVKNLRDYGRSLRLLDVDSESVVRPIDDLDVVIGPEVLEWFGDP